MRARSGRSSIGNQLNNRDRGDAARWKPKHLLCLPGRQGRSPASNPSKLQKSVLSFLRLFDMSNSFVLLLPDFCKDNDLIFENKF